MEGGTDSTASHLIRWDKITKPTSKGDFGNGRVIERNKALLGKRIWSFSKEEEALWVNVIKSKYGPNKMDVKEQSIEDIYYVSLQGQLQLQYPYSDHL